MVLTRGNNPTEELTQVVEKIHNGIKLSYEEVYYLDYAVDEDTGEIDKDNLVPHYTKEQTTRNMKALKNAYFIAKGAVAPNEIIKFRKKYNIAASTLSLILGFSKNTISNIENEGVSSLPSGRFIKLCLYDTKLLSQYVKSCAYLDPHKKNELYRSLTAGG